MFVLIVASLIGLIYGDEVPVGIAVDMEPRYHPIQSLYHSQDINGQYSYGYATPMITSNEVKTSDLVTKGGYSYIDSNGILQTVKYTADPIHGFRVAATNLPQDEPDVAEAKAKHLALFQATQEGNAIAAQNIQAAHARLPQPVQDLPEVAKAKALHMATLAAAYAGVLPQGVQELPEVIKARTEHLATVEAVKARDEALRKSINLSPLPEHLDGNVVPVHTNQVSGKLDSLEYKPTHDLGIYSYGYVGAHSAAAESRTPDGVTTGGYSYIDANGILQTVKYIADGTHGFRVAATNLPRVPIPTHGEQINKLPTQENVVILDSYSHQIKY